MFFNKSAIQRKIYKYMIREWLTKIAIFLSKYLMEQF